MTDRTLVWAEANAAWAIRRLISLYQAWLSVATRGRSAIEHDGVMFEVHKGVAWPLRRTHDAVLHSAVRDKVVFDVGCGSGYLGLMAAKRGASGALLIDRQAKALESAQENAERLGVTDRVRIVAGNVLADVTDTADLIISDPPWFREEMGHRHRWTTDPGFVEALLEQAPSRLVPGGKLRLVVPRFSVPDLLERASRIGWSDPEVRSISRHGGRLRQLWFLDFLPIVAVELHYTRSAQHRAGRAPSTLRYSHSLTPTNR